MHILLYGPIMTAKTLASDLLTVRLNRQVKQRLEGLALAMDRSKSFLAAEAIRNYVELQAWQVEGIKAGLKQADEGRFADPARVKETFRRFRIA